MRYIIMCGGDYTKWEQPKQLTEVHGEPLVARTIRLLKENGVEDIAISTHDERFERFGVPLLEHDNPFVVDHDKTLSGCWVDAFYPTEYPACYLLGDVFFSPEAIKTIVETETDSIEFFASAPPFAPEYPKPWAEPFALKVVDQKRLRRGIKLVKKLDAAGQFNRNPIMWELWTVLQGKIINTIDYDSYVVINDYTCDIDDPKEAERMNNKDPVKED